MCTSKHIYFICVPRTTKRFYRQIILPATIFRPVDCPEFNFAPRLGNLPRGQRETRGKTILFSPCYGELAVATAVGKGTS